MDIKEFESLLSVCIIPAVIKIIMEKEDIDDISAIDSFYKSKTYEFLSIEDSKVWHYSPLCLYTIWKSEKETGEPDWPEEGLLYV